MASALLLVAAIDFGTTYSGWAYSTMSDYKSGNMKIIPKRWSSKTSVATDKTPTCVLIRPDGKTLEAFGYEAEDRYIELIEHGKHHNYYLFSQFKMALYKELENAKTINKGLKLKDVLGRELQALTVFSLTIEYLSQDLLKEINGRFKGDVFTVSNINWVLTVPAIWTDVAKLFMRKAAEMAGIPSDKLLIALEPEAASIFCLNSTMTHEGGQLKSFRAGEKYLVLDAGGGTVDITVHETVSFGRLKEIVAASGGGWGGTEVDKAFERVLNETIGEEVYASFIKDHPYDWLELTRNFEERKRTVTLKGSRKLQFLLPASLLARRRDIEESLKYTRFADSVRFNENARLEFDATLAKLLFQVPIEKIVAHLNTLMSKPEVKGLSAILMVGGFSDSPILFESIQEAFPNIPVIKPIEAVLSVLKGAVIFGHNTNIITERILKYSYGVDTSIPFQNGVHPESRKKVYDDAEWCAGCSFSKHVEKGQSVKVGIPQASLSYSPLSSKSSELLFTVYASKTDPNYVYDTDCIALGAFEVDISAHYGSERQVTCRITFSGTELVVDAVYVQTGDTTSAVFNFLE